MGTVRALRGVVEGKIIVEGGIVEGEDGIEKEGDEEEQEEEERRGGVSTGYAVDAASNLEEEGLSSYRGG